MVIWGTAIGVLLAAGIAISFLVQYMRSKRDGVALLGAGQPRRARNSLVLWALILLAIAYGSLVHFVPVLTGARMVDGAIGVALGLYICAHPAANAVNMLFFERHLGYTFSEWSTLRWLALNLLALLAGWMTVFAGLTRLVDRSL
jgi:hypothetical protein